MKSLAHRYIKAYQFVLRIAIYLEIIIAVIVIAAIVITLLSIPRELATLYENGAFNAFLKTIFNIIIGIELLKMLCRHDMDSVVEVLLFAVSKELIISQRPIVETFVGVAAVAVLFIVRKFLFVSALDKDDPDTHMPGKPIVDDRAHPHEPPAASRAGVGPVSVFPGAFHAESPAPPNMTGILT
ncbi:MAG: hypothetical protein LBR77_03310 [Lachnospiraceae bacterium]|jgi:hypothetical protein|nr:hypothetical protein [Lachnospiraceae bacterium]